MTFASVAEALVPRFAAVPGVRTVQRADQLNLEQPGSVLPQPDDCPLVRIERSRRQGRETGWELAGMRQRHTFIDCDLWASVTDPVGQADGIQNTAEALQQAAVAGKNLGGQADTPTTRLLRLTVTSAMPAARALGRAQRGLLRASFQLDAWEEIVR
jgi:hypothetical protein